MKHAHRNDPDTSREAAARAEASGLVDSDMRLFARLVREHPGCSIKTLASWVSGNGFTATEAERQRLSRRAGDVRRLRLAHTRGKSDDGMLWWPGPEPDDMKQDDLFEPPKAAWRMD